MNIACWTFLPLHNPDGEITGFSFVDHVDYERLKHRVWRRQELPRYGSYARATTGEALHRIILGLKRGDRRQVDHRNHDPLDNRRCNIRAVSRKQNQQNRRGAQRNSRHSRFRGVSRDRRWWVAIVNLGGGKRIKRYCDTEEEAARVAAELRAEHMPSSEMDRTA